MCKTKAQLSLKRCKHFELGYVEIPAGAARTTANKLAVETRRPRVPPLCSRCTSNLGEKLLVRFVNSSFFLQGKRLHGYKTNLSPGVDAVGCILGRKQAQGGWSFCDAFHVILLYRDIPALISCE